MSFWNDPKIATLRDLAGRGWSSTKIADHLGWPCTRSAVTGKCHRLGIQLQSSAGRPKTCEAKRGVRMPPRTPEEYSIALAALKASNIWHLVDLKRAGHSPRFTEHRITSERPVYVLPVIEISACGSSAGLCADQGMGRI